MTDDPDVPFVGDITALLDQAGAELTGLAPVFGAYYRALLGGGCDEKLARQLVRDLHYEQVATKGAEGGEA